MASIRLDDEAKRKYYSCRPEEVRCIHPKVVSIYQREGKELPLCIICNDLSQLQDIKKRRCGECIYPLAPHIEDY